MIEDSTIVAIATPPGEGGVAIVRLSGALAPEILSRMSPKASPDWQSHRLYYGPIQNPEGLILDQGLCCWMKAPHSYTGEEVVEFHLHGGPALASLCLQCCLSLGARLARPGEFTLRAFLNGKLDLAQAEAVQQLIQSRSQLAAQLATRNLQGLFSQQVDRLRHQLLDWLARLEAEIDFGDEVPGFSPQESQRHWQDALGQVERLLQQGQAGKALSDGLRLVIAGPPNAGKSTLLNFLLGRQRALVTPIAGTTRDTLEETLVVAGIPVLLVDTAGLRKETLDPVEQLGIERSREETRQADLILWVVDGHQAEAPELLSDLPACPRLVLLNKSDLGLANWAQAWEAALPVSLLQGEGLEAFWKELEGQVRSLAGGQSEVSRLTQRQWEALAQAQQALLRLGETLQAGLSAEFLALDLRSAIESLGQIQGIDVSEEVLDRIFSTFCLGK